MMSEGRGTNGQFKAGNGFAKGRKRGTQLKYSQYRKMAASYIPSIVKELCEMAVNGDIAAAKIILDRSWPVGAEEIQNMEKLIAELSTRIEELQARAA